jgi:hypothetical protein
MRSSVSTRAERGQRVIHALEIPAKSRPHYDVGRSLLGSNFKNLT